MTETQTLTLDAFLLARIAEDEAEVADWPTEGSWGRYDAERMWTTPDGRPIYAPRSRVLARCAADRLIVAEHPRLDTGGALGARSACDRCSDFGGPYGFDDPENWIDWPCPTLRALALPYAEHPDYREEWRP